MMMEEAGRSSSSSSDHGAAGRQAARQAPPRTGGILDIYLKLSSFCLPPPLRWRSVQPLAAAHHHRNPPSAGRASH